MWKRRRGRRLSIGCRDGETIGRTKVVVWRRQALVRVLRPPSKAVFQDVYQGARERAGGMQGTGLGWIEKRERRIGMQGTGHRKRRGWCYVAVRVASIRSDTGNVTPSRGKGKRGRGTRRWSLNASVHLAAGVIYGFLGIGKAGDRKDRRLNRAHR